MSYDPFARLRELLGPQGDKAAAAMVARLEANHHHHNWTCSLHVTGAKSRALMFWVEPMVPQPLTESPEREHTTVK